ncbi:hypothetical protein [Micromonospora sp. NPDC000442]|uniref:hypothetical protein n=1 Tax=Micromonospora sp. NPDC000442 TaxID=3364217 RepID=UPI00369A237D
MGLESHRQPSEQGFLLGDVFGEPEGVDLRRVQVITLGCTLAHAEISASDLGAVEG